MCVQCMMAATTSVAGASGIRAWLQAHSPEWLCERRMRWVTRGLFALALVAAGTMSGSA
jgi:hypothetical protein